MAEGAYDEERIVWIALLSVDLPDQKPERLTPLRTGRTRVR